MSDNAPEQDYRDVTEEASASWLLGPTIVADDGMVRRALASDEFHAALGARDSSDQLEDGKDIPGALEALASLLGASHAEWQ